MSQQHAPRVPKGVSTGGQFATQHRPEVSISLESHDPWAAPVPESSAPLTPAGPDGLTRDTAVPCDDPRVSAGEVFEHVIDREGTVFSRRTESRFADAPYAIRLQADRELTDDEIHHIAGLTGYSYATAGRGEGISSPERDSARSFIIGADTTKGRVYRNLDVFEDNLDTFIREGSPVRKTDRSGPGTKGTRLVEGLGDKAPKIELYYDNIWEQSPPDVKTSQDIPTVREFDLEKLYEEQGRKGIDPRQTLKSLEGKRIEYEDWEGNKLQGTIVPRSEVSPLDISSDVYPHAKFDDGRWARLGMKFNIIEE